MELNKTTITDKEELLKLLLENPDCLEEGLTLIPEAMKHGATWSAYPSVDRDGAFITVMITARTVGEWLKKALDWCAEVTFEKAKSIIDRHSNLLRHELDESGDFRLVVLAPSHDNEFRRLAAEYDWCLESFCFQAFSADERKLVACFPEHIPPVPSAYEESHVSLGFHLNYMKKKQARDATVELLDYISSLDGAAMKATTDYIIIEDLYENVLGWVRTYRAFSHVQLSWNEENGDSSICYADVASSKDIDDELRDSIIEAIKCGGRGR